VPNEQATGEAELIHTPEALADYGADAACSDAGDAQAPTDLASRGEVRLERFLDVATELFCEKGYQHTRLSEIVARAGGSLATLYRAFGDKEGLVRAIIQRRKDRMRSSIQALILDDMEPEHALRAVAEEIAEQISTREAQVVYRIALGEGSSFPDLRDWFFEHAVASVRSTLSRYFELQIAAGRMKMTCPAAASNQFFMMLSGDVILGISSGHVREPDPVQLREHALGAVDTFLYGTLPR